MAKQDLPSNDLLLAINQNLSQTILLVVLDIDWNFLVIVHHDILGLLDITFPVVFHAWLGEALVVPFFELLIRLAIDGEQELLRICICTDLDEPASLTMLKFYWLTDEIFESFALELSFLTINGHMNISKPEFDLHLHWFFPVDQTEVNKPSINRWVRQSL